MQPARTTTTLFLLTLVVGATPMMFVPDVQAQIPDGWVCVAVGFGANRIATSTDGITWTERTVPANAATVNEVEYGGGVWVVSGINPASGDQVISYSLDNGATWNDGNAGEADDAFDIAYNGDAWVVVGTENGGAGTQGRGSTSSLGTSWSAWSNLGGTTNQWFAVTADPLTGRFVTVARDGTSRVATSDDDGATWTLRTASMVSVWQEIEWGAADSIYVAVGTTSDVMSSPDGITWTTRTGSVGAGEGLGYGNGRFIAVSSSGAARSVDGITWDLQSMTGQTWTGVSYHGGLSRWIAVSDNGATNRVTRSDNDGVTWTDSAGLSTATEWQDVECADSVAFQGCIGTETCSSATVPETSFRDARVSFGPTPFLFVREDGGAFDAPDDTGRLLKYDADLGLLASTHPCTSGNPGSAPWEYTHEGTFGLSVTADERIVVSCLVFTDTSPTTIQSRIKILTNASLDTADLVIAWTTGASTETIPGWALDRLDSSYSQTVGLTERQEDAHTIDAQTIAIKACDTTGNIVGLGVDVRTNRTVTVSDQGLKVWPTTATGVCTPTQSSGAVTGTKAALYEEQIAVGRATDTRLYTWSSSGFSLVATNVSLGMSDGHESNLRYSKDGDFLVWWTGTGMRVLNATNLETLSGPHTLTGGTINGCDMDVLNNYVYCVTDGTIHRVAVHGDIPSFFGNPKEGNFTDPSGQGDPFQEQSTLFTQPGDPVVIGDTFLGVDTAAGIEFFGETGFAAFISLILIGGMSFAFYLAFAQVGKGENGAGLIGAGAGAFLGMAVAVGLEVMSLLWAVLLGLLAIAATVFVIWRR